MLCVYYCQHIIYKYQIYVFILPQLLFSSTYITNFILVAFYFLISVLFHTVCLGMGPSSAVFWNWVLDKQEVRGSNAPAVLSSFCLPQRHLLSVAFKQKSSLAREKEHGFQWYVL
jgi:hypothetical protein